MDEDDKTRLISRRERAAMRGGDETIVTGQRTSATTSVADDGHTKLYRPRRTSSVGTAAKEEVASSGGHDGTEDPVVGWLVVLAGPGQGQSMKHGYGMNTIGRSSDERVALDFGDEQITRKGHAMLTYDPRGRQFYIQHGGGTNLTYVGDAPVLQPVELKGREVIGIGDTQLVFIPFCGADFDWQDQ